MFLTAGHKAQASYSVLRRGIQQSPRKKESREIRIAIITIHTIQINITCCRLHSRHLKKFIKNPKEELCCALFVRRHTA